MNIKVLKIYLDIDSLIYYTTNIIFYVFLFIKKPKRIPNMVAHMPVALADAP